MCNLMRTRLKFIFVGRFMGFSKFENIVFKPLKLGNFESFQNHIDYQKFDFEVSGKLNSI